jgi:GDP-mannose 6-dehydrogenase
MRISIFGLGYVGCVTAACLARAGHEVIGVDVNPEKTTMINEGRSPVVEPGLGELVSEMVSERRLRATVSADYAVKNTELAMICVGTPSGPNGQIDTTALERVAQDIGRALEGRTQLFTIVLRSTVLPGTTEAVLVQMLRQCLGDGFEKRVALAVNPEFMREGTSIADFEHPALTLVGSDNPAAADRIRILYSQIDAPFINTSVKVAEMMKYVSNAFHALKICFANEIGDLCESLGVDPLEVSRTFVMDRKLNISEAYLRPGFAFGGSCLPKDLRALMYAARRSDVDLPLLSSITASNEHQVRRGIDAVLSARRKRVGVVGLAFKSGTDDLRESPMVALVESLIGKGCTVRIFDRNVRLASLVGANRRYIEKEIPHISSLICDDLETLIAESEVIVIGGGGEDAVRALAQCRPDQTIVDLTRATTGSKSDSKQTSALEAIVSLPDFIAV